MFIPSKTSFQSLFNSKKIYFLLLALSTSLAFQASAEKHKYPKLKPADPPCLFLLDENTGQATGNPVNAPCELGSITIKPGQKVNPMLRKKYGEVTQDGKTKVRKRPGRVKYGDITLKRGKAGNKKPTKFKAGADLSKKIN
ncbi:MAG: hypothetical protein Q9M92_14565 [Enterobacterales bacterium]|nr:hypothetical protein [Enterobacterales bacterium]